MRHEYFAVRIRKAIEKDSRPSPTATFSGGDFAPDLVNRLKRHLRAVEEAQLQSVQQYKEVIKIRSHTGQRASKIMEQIYAARKAS